LGHQAVYTSVVFSPCPETPVAMIRLFERSAGRPPAVGHSSSVLGPQASGVAARGHPDGGPSRECAADRADPRRREPRPARPFRYGPPVRRDYGPGGHGAVPNSPTAPRQALRSLVSCVAFFAGSTSRSADQDAAVTHLDRSPLERSAVHHYLGEPSAGHPRAVRCSTGAKVVSRSVHGTD